MRTLCIAGIRKDLEEAETVHKRSENALFGCMRSRVLALVAVLLLACSMFVATPLALADEEPKEEETTEVAETKDDAAEEKKDEAAADTNAEAAKDDAKDAAADAADAADDAEAKASKELPAGAPEDAFTLGNDLLWFNDQCEFLECIVPNDLIGAGETIKVSNAKVGGSIRVAGRIISIANTTVTESVTAAGQNISFDGGSARVVALAGKDVAFTGNTTDLYLAGNKVIINGLVTGDVHVYGGDLELGPNAVIQGTLYGDVNPDPTFDDTAVIGQNRLHYSDKKEESEDPMDLFDWPVIGLSAASCLLIALLIEWLAGGLTVSAANLLKERPASYLLSGILGVVLVPIALILLCIPIVTIPAVIALALVVIALLLISGGFVAALFARLLFPNKSRYITAGILGLFFGALMAMPYVGHPLRLIGYIFTLGFAICIMRKGMKERRDKRNEELIQF